MTDPGIPPARRPGNRAHNLAMGELRAAGRLDLLSPACRAWSPRSSPIPSRDEAPPGRAPGHMNFQIRIFWVALRPQPGGRGLLRPWPAVITAIRDPARQSSALNPHRRPSWVSTNITVDPVPAVRRRGHGGLLIIGFVLFFLATDDAHLAWWRRPARRLSSGLRRSAAIGPQRLAA